MPYIQHKKFSATVRSGGKSVSITGHAAAIEDARSALVANANSASAATGEQAEVSDFVFAGTKAPADQINAKLAKVPAKEQESASE